MPRISPAGSLLTPSPPLPPSPCGSGSEQAEGKSQNPILGPSYLAARGLLSLSAIFFLTFTAWVLCSLGRTGLFGDPRPSYLLRFLGHKAPRLYSLLDVMQVAHGIVLTASCHQVCSGFGCTHEAESPKKPQNSSVAGWRWQCSWLSLQAWPVPVDSLAPLRYQGATSHAWSLK